MIRRFLCRIGIHSWRINVFSDAGVFTLQGMPGVRQVSMVGAMRITDLLRNQGTGTQMTILMRADIMFADVNFHRRKTDTWRGRYFGGILTSEQVETLTEGLKMKETK